MSRRRWLLALVGALLLPPRSVLSQTEPSRERQRELLMRAESILAVIRMADSVRRDSLAQWRVGRIVQDGPVVAVFWDSVPSTTRAAIVRDARAMLASSVLPESAAAGAVAVQIMTSDTAEILRDPRAGGRRPAAFWWVDTRDTAWIARRVAEAIVSVVMPQYDTIWRAWLPFGVSVGWRADREGDVVLRALASPGSERGAECLSGRLPSCRLWLGLDADAEPYAVRYTIAELQRAASHHPNQQEYAACRDGSESVCLRMVRGLIDVTPAPWVVRASLIQAIAATYGREAAMRALADSSGSIADRIGRATGQPVDTIVAKWRAWGLGRGRTERVRAGLADILPALVTSLLLLTLATRSGRWR